MALLDPANRTPVSEGDSVAAWTAAEVLESRGDLSILRASGDIPARVAVFRYRGAEPLPRFLEQLKADGEQWRTLRHPNLMPTLETGRLPSQITCYWAQEEVPGTPLADRLAIHPLIAPDHALAIARQVGTAIAVVHRAELLHGDVGPHNIFLVDSRDRPRLAWGGLAVRLEAAGMDAGRSGPRLVATAPEMLMGKAFGPSSDVFGLCSLLYRMLAGQPAWNVRRGGPLPGVTSTEPLPSLPEWVSPEVARLLSDGLQRDPARRPDLFELVDRIEDHESALRGVPVPLGTWSPTAMSSAEASATPPTVNRTVEPMVRDDTLDPLLANTPPSVTRPPEPVPTYHTGASVVPAGGRSMGPGSMGPGSTGVTGFGSRGSQSARFVPAPAPAASPMLVPASVLAGAVILGVFLFVGLWQFAPPLRLDDGRPVPTSPVTPAPSPPPVAVAGALAPPPKVGPALLTIVSEPTAAEVWEEGRFVDLTPAQVALDPADGTRERVFELRLAGHVTQSVRQPFSEVDIRHSVTLRPVPRPVPGPSPNPTAAANTRPAPKPAPKPDLGIKVER